MLNILDVRIGILKTNDCFLPVYDLISDCLECKPLQARFN